MESERRIRIDGTNPVVLFGFNDEHLRILEEHFGAVIIGRGERIMIRAEDKVVDLIEKVLKELMFIVNKTESLSERDVHTVIDIMTGGAAPEISPEDLDDVVLYAKKDYIKAKTPGQSSYLRSIKANDIVFAIGPAGTGKTSTALIIAKSMAIKKDKQTKKNTQSIKTIKINISLIKIRTILSVIT